MTITANSQGVVRGKIRIPSGIPAGEKLVSVTGSSGTRAEAVYSGQGAQARQAWQQRNAATEVRWQSPPAARPFIHQAAPLAQTLTLAQSMQIAGLDLWFEDAPTSPLLVQLRETIAGLPDGQVLAEALVNPSQVAGNLPPGTPVPGQTVNQRIACTGSGSVTIPTGVTSVTLIGRGTAGTSNAGVNRISNGFPDRYFGDNSRPVSNLPASLVPFPPGVNTARELYPFTFVGRMLADTPPPVPMGTDPEGNVVACYLANIRVVGAYHPSAPTVTLNYVIADVVANNGPNTARKINEVQYGPEVFTETPYSTPIPGEATTARLAGADYAFPGASAGTLLPPSEQTHTAALPGTSPTTLSYAVPPGASLTVSYEVPIHTTPVGQPLASAKATRIVFDAPAFLVGGAEYAIVVHCDDTDGSLAVAELGKFDEDAQTWITNQPYTVGVLLTSSNGRSWNAHQDKDLTFRLLAADFIEPTRIITLGTVQVEAATDLMLLAYAERPSSTTNAEYVLTLPDATEIVVSDGQPVQLSAPISGNVQISARLVGTAAMAPVLYPGTQLVYGSLQTVADYVSRAIPAGSNVTIKVIFEAVLPSGANVQVDYIGQDTADTWQVMALTATHPTDDGFTELTYEASNVTETTVRTRLLLSGTPAARPRIRGLRVIVL